MRRILKPAFSIFSSVPALLKAGHPIVQLGGFWSEQGKAQHIDIQGLIGDDFTLRHSQGSNGLVGLGYLIDGEQNPLYKMAYGVNAFYLAPTRVSGQVIQESLFTNLAYHYRLTHYPVYALAKSSIQTRFSQQYAITLEAGIGPNFVQASGFKESSLDGRTQPDHIFSNHTTATFSATAGIGLKSTPIFGQAPLECGYHFFYLGRGRLDARTNQVLQTLHTGSNYANAVMCSITV